MVRVGVFLDTEVLLNLPARIRKEGPLRADRAAELVRLQDVVRGDRDDLRVRDVDLGVEGS